MPAYEVTYRSLRAEDTGAVYRVLLLADDTEDAKAQVKAKLADQGRVIEVRKP